MIITIPWLKEHLKTNLGESEIVNQLTNMKELQRDKINLKILKLQKFLKLKNILMQTN